VADVVIIGGGVGGLAAAIRLGAAGHAVTVLERNANLGGKLAERERDGFHFDVGPSLLTLPELYDSLFELSGTSLSAEVELVRLDPQIRYRWPDGTTLDARDDVDATAKGFEALAAGGGDAFRRFDAHGGRIWEVSQRTFLAGPMAGPLTLARRMRSLRELTAIDGLRTLSGRARRMFDDPRLVQWAERYATYSGSSPFAAPATLSCIPHVEAAHGAWYPLGGVSRLRDALVRAARRTGAVLRPGIEVEAIENTEHRVRAVRTAGGERVPADVVVADIDAEHLYTDLLPIPPLRRRVRRAPRSLSAIVIAAGVRGRTDGIAHHNIWFSESYAREFRQLVRERRTAEEPTIYACVSSTTDPDQAPPGDENWLLLMNAPAGVDIDRESARDHALVLLAERGVDLRERLLFTEVMGPQDIADRYRSTGGAIYGPSSNGRRAAFLRPRNRGPLRGLYLVGGSTHPGGGLPLVLIGSRIVAELIREDGW
jgi:phytoene desaturase